MTKNTNKRFKTSKCKISFWGSGNASLLEPLLQKNTLEITSLVSDKENSRLPEKARKYNIPFFFYEEAMKNIKILPEFDAVFLGGFLKKIPENIIRKYLIINLHPSLLPHFGGKGMYGEKVYQKLFSQEKKFTGITLHRADEKYDTGKIFFQKLLPVKNSVIATEQAVRHYEKIVVPVWLEFILKKTNNLS